MKKYIKRLIVIFMTICLISVPMVLSITIESEAAGKDLPIAIRVNYYKFKYKHLTNGKKSSKSIRQMDLSRTKNRIYKVTLNTNIYNKNGKKVGSSKKGNYMIRYGTKVYKIKGKYYYYMQKVEKLNELYVSDRPLNDSKSAVGYVRIENVGKISGGQYIVGVTNWNEKFNKNSAITKVCYNYDVISVFKYWKIEPPMVS